MSNFLFRYFRSILDIEEDEMEKPHLEKLPQIAFQSIGLSGFTSCNKYHLDGKFCRISKFRIASFLSRFYLVPKCTFPPF